MSNISLDASESGLEWELESHTRRTERRSPYDALVRVMEPTKGIGVALNVSESGIRVVVDCELRPSDVCRIVLVDRGGSQRTEQMRVAWSRRLRDGWVAGLERIGFH